MRFEALIPSPTRSHQIVTAIEQEIRSGRIQRGQKLASETRLAAQFGVSRSVVREAVKLLEAMGLVVSRQGSGSYVRNDPSPAVARVLALTVPPDPAAADELFALREILEVAAVRLAAQRRSETHLVEIGRRFEANAAAAAARDPAAVTRTDRDLHLAIHQASGNRYLAVLLAAIRELQHDIVALVSDDLGAAERAVDQHRAVVDGVRDASPDRAERAVRDHIRATVATARAHQPAD